MYGWLVLYLRVFSVGLKTVSPGSPMMMSAAQCVMLARSAARAERTETLNVLGNFCKKNRLI